MPKQPTTGQLVADIRSLRLQAEKVKLQRFVGKYDVAQPNKQRRQAQIERETEDQQLKLYDRLKVLNILRDVARNSSAGRSVEHQFRTQVVGTGPKVQIHPANAKDAERAKQAEKWFNSPEGFYGNCDFRSGQDFGGITATIEATLKREGDCVVLFDDGVIEGSGQFLFWEADQLVTPDDYKESDDPNADKIDQGVITDKWGREIGYCVTNGHGAMTAPRKNCTFLKAARVGGSAWMLRKTWRLNQKRGTPEMIAAAADQQDLYELREKIKQTAKVVATMAGVVKKKDAGQELDLRRELQDASAEDTEAATGSSAEGSGSQQVAYERLGSLTGGALEYLEDDDDFQLLDTDRPSLDFMDVLDRILRQAGASVGLTKTYSTMSTEASYTAFRGDLLLSWTTFEVDQKFLERNWCDRAARMAINKRFGEFEWSASWEWPTMPAVDPLKDAQARVYMLQHLLSSYSKELGPQWRSIFASLAEESKVAKEDHKLPLRIFEGEKDAVRFTNLPKSDGSDAKNDKDTET